MSGAVLVGTAAKETTGRSISPQMQISYATRHTRTAQQRKLKTVHNLIIVVRIAIYFKRRSNDLASINIYRYCYLH